MEWPTIFIFLLESNRTDAFLICFGKSNHTPVNLLISKVFVRGRFEWQNGFGAFSVSQSQVSRLITYIENQEEHHKKQTFQMEYLAFLKEYEIDFKQEYLFEPIS